jgi:hypothetical protein
MSKATLASFNPSQDQRRSYQGKESRNK